MNQTLKFIGLLAILPLALVALTPDLIGETSGRTSGKGMWVSSGRGTKRRKIQ